jgi:hypothetical protein
MDIKYFIARP